jgi:class 3 adenylate cyclase
VAAEHDGRLVKQLGDGVMLIFERVPDGIAAMRALADAAAADGDLPPLHIGVAAGPVIERDADLYGRTVNMAARISGVAGPGEILLNDVAAAEAAELSLERLGDVELKGFAAPVPLSRLVIA